jgi:hypothetical protein
MAAGARWLRPLGDDEDAHRDLCMARCLASWPAGACRRFKTDAGRAGAAPATHHTAGTGNGDRWWKDVGDVSHQLNVALRCIPCLSAVGSLDMAVPAAGGHSMIHHT